MIDTNPPQPEAKKEDPIKAEAPTFQPLIMEYDILKNVHDFDSIKTSKYLIEGNEALNGFEGADVLNLVLNFQQMRSDCLNFRTVYRLLGKQSLLADNTVLLDATKIPQIGRDLEERNKQVTLNALKKQGESYRDFNAKIVELLDESEESTGESFTGRVRRIEKGTHYEERYNLDEMISKRYGHIAREALKSKHEQLRKRELKK